MKGFSLLEILLVCFISLLLITIGIPTFKHVSQSANANNIGTKLLNTIRIARNEAMLRNQTVILCKSSDQKNCGGSWEQGFLIRTDTHIIEAYKNGMMDGIIHWHPFQVIRDTIVFPPNGVATDANGTFTYCLNQRVIWTIIVNKEGRAKIAHQPAIC